MGRANGDHRRTAKEQSERVRVGRVPERQTGVREAFTRGDSWNAEDSPVGGEMTEREVRQCFKGVSPRKTGTKRVQEGVEGRWVLARWGMPKYARDRERVGIYRN